jgi:hypothetical protein
MGGKIRGYEEQFMEHVARGEFSVDTEGRVWKHVDLHKGPIVPPRRAERGKVGQYLQVRFMHEGRRLNATAHRCVFRALKGPIPHGCEVNHDNGVKDDNRPHNLLSETPSGNTAHARRHELMDQYGEKNPAAKLSDNQVAQIRLAYSKGGFTMEQLGERFGVRFQHISRIVRGQRRLKQGGVIASEDLRHSACERDPITQRFVARVEVAV